MSKLMKIVSKLRYLAAFSSAFQAAWVNASEPLTLTDALNRAYGGNPEIAAMEARAASERALIRSRYWLADPKVGLMHEKDLNDMEVRDGPMNLWTVSQEVMFPTKYLTLGAAQSERAEAAHQEFLDKKLEVRQKTITAYYSLYSSRRMLTLLEAQREALREIARVAEARRATGAVPQQDEMKAHVEQTRIENQILLQRQETVELQSQLNALLNRDAQEEVTFGKIDLKTPKVTEDLKTTHQKALEGSKTVASSRFLLEQAAKEKSVAVQSYLPDFVLSYRKPYTNAPSGAFAASFEMTIPLWFFAKQSSEVASASAKKIEAEKNLEYVSRTTEAEALSLSSKAETYAELLRIYETALIPQATSSLNSSRAAYSAGRTGFLELLDSERSQYSVQMEYYQNMSKFVESLTRLERVTGSSLSSLPF